jgi:hypothetical protein
LVTTEDAINQRPGDFLVATFQGGGNLPLILPIAHELTARGHRVRVLAGPGSRASRVPVSERFRDRAGAVLAQGCVRHVYRFRAGLVERMVVRR